MSQPSFESFLFDVDPQYRSFAEEINEILLSRGFKLGIEQAKSGLVLSYKAPKTGKTALNFVFRKSGLLARIYADNLSEYEDILGSLTDELRQKIEKAPVCKRLHNPADCSSRCPMGYIFTLNGTLHKKCRYSSFFIQVNGENIPFIKAMIEKEAEHRTKLSV